MAKPGDIVRFLNTVGGGRITKIKDNIAYVEDEDGFETPVLIKECVVVGSASLNVAPNNTPKKPNVSTAYAPMKQVAERQPQRSMAPSEPEMEELPVIETPEGEKLNLTLAFEPVDIKRLSTTTFDTYLVNDSNYYLYFTFLTRGNESRLWTTRYAGIVEPNIQLFIGEIAPDQLPEMDRVAVQYIAFKQDKPFEQKLPQFIEEPLDTTKFAKLHCFTSNIYFDNDVLALNLVTNDAPHRAIVVDKTKLEAGMKAKKAVDMHHRKTIVKKRSRAERKAEGTLVVDLHIDALVDSTRGLSNADMLNLQVDEFSRIMDANFKNKGQKIVFIHGKGEGVLRNAILKELNHRYKGHDVQDASFREYGFGATQVTIR
ncbi:MAG: DUF2027 domain-containing protein [Firmicutes bacterium]|nr:DUF2027 domain-containing protein [Bacillota bacterium]MCM1401778.1 DUF2027 domain-containing protein [Bacteroides sp.]MCM1477646.1 DUF2027 domain-containing protein [Bacteroides sp.]